MAEPRAATPDEVTYVERRRSIIDFVTYCMDHPGEWFVYAESYKGSCGQSFYKYSEMKWSQKKNFDEGNTTKVMGKYVPASNQKETT